MAAGATVACVEAGGRPGFRTRFVGHVSIETERTTEEVWTWLNYTIR
jgi:hypothetical protein